MLVAVLVRMREQRLLAIGFLDVGLGAARPHRLQAQDVVEGGRLAPPDAQDGGLLLDGVFPLLVPLIVFATASSAPVGIRGVRPRGGCAWRHGAERDGRVLGVFAT